MTTGTTVSWNKIITVCSVFGIPSISLVFMVAVWGTKMMAAQAITNENIKEIKQDLIGLHHQVDTIANRQHDNMLIEAYKEKYQNK